MKRLVVLCVIIALAGISPARAAEYACVAPRCYDVAIPVSGDLIVPENRVRVLLPDDYASTTERYPVLYLLHGAGDTYTTWTQNTDVDAFTASLDLIVVMPDSGRNANAGWYADWVDDSRDWESFHIDVMIPFIDSAYRTIPEQRAVAGLSMGGYGAMYYAAAHPEMFDAAASFSGAVDITYGAPASGVVFSAFHDMFGTPNDKVWGNQVTAFDNWQAHNPTALAARLDGLTVLIASGNGLPGGKYDDPGNPGGHALENGVFQMNLSFVRALTLAGVEHTTNFYGSGHHAWPYWQDALHWAVPQIVSSFAD
jgi:S-formylglutathione hydrolase FrmB